MFDIVGDDLAFLMKKALDEGVIQGLVPHSVDGGVAILQYAYHYVLDDILENARNVKFILSLFEQLSRLKINFHKSEIYCLGPARQRSQQYNDIFTCATIDIPMKYLGMPIDEKRLVISRWDPLDERME
jgi:hypothetical protein